LQPEIKGHNKSLEEQDYTAGGKSIKKNIDPIEKLF
jgi:hypothetical protein